MNRTQIERKVNLVLDDCLGISFDKIEDEEMQMGEDWTIGEVYDLVERKMK